MSYVSNNPRKKMAMDLNSIEKTIIIFEEVEGLVPEHI